MGNGAVRMGLAAIVVAAGSVVASPPPVAAEVAAPVCVEPTIEDLGPYVPVDDDVPGEAFGVVAPAAVISPFLDTDGDDQADAFTYDESANRIDIVRGDGTASVTGLPPSIAWTGSSAVGHGDLDGDGRDEVWGRFRTQGTFGYDATLVVSGALPVGSSSAATVALQVRGRVVGDVDADGLNDVEVVVEAPATFPPLPFREKLLGHHRFVGALVPGPSGPSFPADAPYYGIGADVDLDGHHDVVTIGQGGAPGTLHLSASDTTLEFASPTAYGAVVFSRDAGGTYLTTTPRPAYAGPFHLFRLHLDCIGAWIGPAGEALLGRPGTVADLQGFDPQADLDLVERLAIALPLYRSVEGRTHLVEQRFQQALGRSVDPVGRAWWVQALREGRRSPQNLSATLFGSGEFYRANGSTPDGWVSALYQRALGYAPDATGAAYWKKQASALGRERAGVRFLNAGGARRALVRAWYLEPTGMGRAATAAEVTTGEALLADGGWDAFAPGVVSGDASYARAQTTHGTLPAA